MRFVAALLLVANATGAADDSWDAGKALNRELGESTGGKVQLIFELRSRVEYRPNQAFGNDADLFADFTRVRFGGTYKPASWLRFSGTAMDARAPLYGTPAPSSARDPLEWHEGFVELRPESKLGFGAVVGRHVVNYGDTRLVGSPQWAYIPRTYDGARVYWRTARVRLEGLFIAPVKLDSSRFNKPVLGEHLVGTYNVVQLNKHVSADLYFLGRRQNRAGGFSGAGSLAVDSFGTRLFGPIGDGYRYSVEAVKQTGQIGGVPHRAYAWAAQVARRFSTIPVDAYVEYKFASGESRPGRSGAFDQLYPAAHDKLGHADVLGWRNVKNWRAQATWTGAPGLSVALMYNNSWLADARDAAYNLQGRPIARSATGMDGTHIGQELDLYFAYRRSGWTAGAGYGRFLAGEFIERTSPGRSPAYAYVFQSYSF